MNKAIVRLKHNINWANYNTTQKHLITKINLSYKRHDHFAFKHYAVHISVTNPLEIRQYIRVNFTIKICYLT